MNPLTSIDKTPVSAKQIWRSIEGSQLDVLTDIYQEHTNIAIWQRSLANALIEAADSILDTNPTLQASLVVTPQEANVTMNQHGSLWLSLPHSHHQRTND